MTSTTIQDVMQVYASFDPALIQRLETIYSVDLVFLDPFHRIEGLPPLKKYFSGMLDGLDECHFEFHQVIDEAQPNTPEPAGQAVLFWTMHYRHARLAGGKALSITGNSHIKYREKIYYHRDYFDAGAMIYEHLPLLGFGVRQVKKRMEV